MKLLRNCFETTQIVVVILFFSMSCTTVVVHEPKGKIPHAQVQDLKDVKNWTIHGKVALQHQSKNWASNFVWQKSSNYYKLQLFGPIGIQRISLETKNKGVELQTSEGIIRWAHTPETLIQNMTGQYIPVSKLLHWIRALPSDYFIFNSMPNHISIQDGDWVIYYEKFISYGTFKLPVRIRIQHAHYQLKLVINQWKLL